MGMPLMEKEKIINSEKDLDNINGRLTPDHIIQAGELSYANRRSHNYSLWTTLSENLLPKASVSGLYRSLSDLDKHIEEQTSKKLINILTNCRDYIDVYFNATKTNPVYIQHFDRGDKNIDDLKRIIHESQFGLSYFGGDVLSKQMQEQVTITSLYVRDIIASTVGFKQVSHYPSQVKYKLDKYKLRAFLLDSHYKRENGNEGEGIKEGIEDCRKMTVEY